MRGTTVSTNYGRGALPVRWAKFAFSYWMNLLVLAPKVAPEGARMLLWKLGPPYPSACRRVRDLPSGLKLDLLRRRATRRAVRCRGSFGRMLVSAFLGYQIQGVSQV